MSGLSETNQAHKIEELTKKVNPSKKTKQINLDVLFEKKAFCVLEGFISPKYPSFSKKILFKM